MGPSASTGLEVKDREQDGEECSEESGQEEETASEHPQAREDDDQGGVKDGRVDQAAFETLLIRLGAPGHFDGGGDGFGSGDGVFLLNYHLAGANHVCRELASISPALLECRATKIDSKNSYFIYLKEPPLNDLPKERAGWQYKVVGPKKFWTQLGLPLKLFGQKEKLDVFYSPSHYAPRFSPMPTIVSIMDLWHHRRPEQFDKKDLYRLLNWEKYSVKNSSRIVTISEFTKSEIIKFYNYTAKRITVAYPGYTKLKIKN